MVNGYKVVSLIVMLLMLFSELSCSETNTSSYCPKTIREPGKYNATETLTPEIRRKESKRLYYHGRSLFNEGRYEEAIWEFKRILEQDPESEYCRYASDWIIGTCHKMAPTKERRADILLKLRSEGESALGLFIDGVIKYAVEAWDLREWGHILEAEQKEKEALENYQRIIERYPESGLADNAKYKIGIHYSCKHNYARAIEEFTRVIGEYPESDSAPLSQRYIGMCYENQKQYERAIEEYRKVIKKYPKSLCAAEAQSDIGTIYWWYFHDYPQAIIEYQKVIDNYPDHPDIHIAKDQIKRCSLLYEFQKQEVDTTKHSLWIEGPEKLQLLLELYNLGVKNIEDYQTTKTIDELQGLIKFYKEKGGQKEGK
ncbi:MAG: tetratricopeptide repeat protein [bacterium]